MKMGNAVIVQDEIITTMKKIYIEKQIKRTPSTVTYTIRKSNLLNGYESKRELSNRNKRILLKLLILRSTKS